jgi:hypothetical protein
MEKNKEKEIGHGSDCKKRISPDYFLSKNYPFLSVALSVRAVSYFFYLFCIFCDFSQLNSFYSLPETRSQKPLSAVNDQRHAVDIACRVGS